MKSPLFQILTKKELDHIDGSRYEVKFKAGETMLKQGSAITNLLSITSGIAKMYVEGYSGKNMIVRIYKPWDLIGGWAIYYSVRHHYSVAAIEDTTACYIDIQAFKEVIRGNPDFAEAYIRELSIRGNYCVERLVNITQKQMHGRIADALLYLSEGVFNANPFRFTLTRQDMGDLTGMSKDSAIRILKEFENEGVIEVNGKELHIKQTEVLHDIALKG
jgi:CRP/FNR family transcriptional regulator